MKSLRYILVGFMAFVATDALAWKAEVNEAILLFAEENLSNKAKKEVNAILGTSLRSIKFENKGKSITRLDENGKSVTADEKDAVVLLEKAISVLGSDNSSIAERKAALLMVAEMTVDIHCPSNIHIDKHLEKDFTFGRDNGRPKNSRWFRVQKRQWQAMWHSQYHRDHLVFSPEMYCYDWRIATKGMAKKYKKEVIAPRMWAEQTGQRVLKSLEIFQPDAVVNMLEITKQEEVNNSCMYDAAFRLANLLNKTL